MNVTVFIPIHEYNETVKPLIERAVKSVNEGYKAVALTTEEIASQMKKDGFTGISYKAVENTSFQHMLNAAAEACSTEFFSILEFDDEYRPKWFENVETYRLTGDLASVYLPIIEEIDATNEAAGPYAYLNESVWAAANADRTEEGEVRLGYVTESVLGIIKNFTLAGAVINKNDFIRCGGIKESMKDFFIYEFMLRLTRKDKDGNANEMFVVPRVGYFHRTNRPGSISVINRETMSREERNWWEDTATRECLYKEDRNKKYEE